MVYTGLAFVDANGAASSARELLETASAGDTGIATISVVAWRKPFFVAGADSDKTVVRLGLLLPMTGWAAGLFIVGAASLAVADINASPTLMQGRRVEYKWRDDGCSSIKGTTALSRMLEGDPIHAVIGATCSVACLPTGYLSAGRNVPQISSACSSGVIRSPHYSPSRLNLLALLCRISRISFRFVASW